MTLNVGHKHEKLRITGLVVRSGFYQLRVQSVIAYLRL